MNFDPDKLDPGIRSAVLHLRARGFITTDSGDGTSKPADARAMDIPHVVIKVDPAVLVAEANRLRLVVERTGKQVGPCCGQDPALVEIHASYDPDCPDLGLILVLYFVLP
jgi:hypothetical protein